MKSTQDNTQKMSEEMQHIIDHARALVDVTSGELDDWIKSAREALKERLDSSKSGYRDLEKQLMSKVMEADEFIHVKPYYAIGGTFIGGMLPGDSAAYPAKSSKIAWNCWLWSCAKSKYVWSRHGFWPVYM